MNHLTTRLGIVLAVFALCGFFGTSQLPAEPLSVDDNLDAGTTGEGERIQEVADAAAHFSKREFDKALELLKQAAEKHPDLPPAEIIMAQLFGRIRQVQGMQAWLERAVVEHPGDPEPYVLFGDMALQGRRVTDASLLYRQASVLLTKFEGSTKRKDVLAPRVQSGLAAVAEARREWATAQKYLEAWLKIQPKSVAAMQRLARVLFQQKQAQSALEMLRDAAKIEPKVLTPEAQLATFYQGFDDSKNAKKWMRIALQKAPKDLRTRLVAAQWSLQTGQLDQAEEQAAAAMQLDPDSLDAKNLRGAIALFRKNYKDAEMYFESAHLQSPENFAVTNSLALALCEQADEAKKRRALEYARSSYRQHPKSAEAAATLGWTLYQLNQLDQAARALQSAISSGQLSANTAYYVARVYTDQGKNDQAKTLLENALKTKRPFRKREDAELLLKQVAKSE